MDKLITENLRKLHSVHIRLHHNYNNKNANNYYYCYYYYFKRSLLQGWETVGVADQYENRTGRENENGERKKWKVQVRLTKKH